MLLHLIDLLKLALLLHLLKADKTDKIAKTGSHTDNYASKNNRLQCCFISVQFVNIVEKKRYLDVR